MYILVKSETEFFSRSCFNHMRKKSEKNMCYQDQSKWLRKNGWEERMLMYFGPTWTHYKINNPGSNCIVILFKHLHYIPL